MQTINHFFSFFTNRDSISHRVFLGYLTNLLLLMILAGATFWGFGRLNKWINNTDKVDNLLHQIYLAQIEINSYSLNSKISKSNSVDSLMSEITITLNDVRNTKLFPKSSDALFNIDMWLSEYNQYWKMFVELNNQKTLSQERMNILFDRIFANARNPILQIGTSNYNVRTKEVKQDDFFTQLLYLKEIERVIWEYPYSKIDTSKFNVVFADVFGFLEQKSSNKNSEIKDGIATLSKDLKSYKFVVNELLNAVYELNKAQNQMSFSAENIQTAVEVANQIQNQALENGALLLFYILTVIIISALILGFSISLLYLRKINREEEIRKSKDKSLLENRKLLNDIIDNSSSIIYVKK